MIARTFTPRLLPPHGTITKMTTTAMYNVRTCYICFVILLILTQQKLFYYAKEFYRQFRRCLLPPLRRLRRMPRAQTVLAGMACDGHNRPYHRIYRRPTIAGLALLIPSIATGVRRLHDTGRSGLWYLLIFVPITGSIILLVFFLLPRKEVDNKYLC